MTVPVPKAPFVTEPAAPVEEMPAINKPPETVVPPVYVLGPDNLIAPPVALTVNRFEPEIVPFKFAVIELNTIVVEPVDVNVWRL